MTVSGSDAVFAALADPTRRQVLRPVAERGPTSATSLGRELPVTRQAIVKHLVVLMRAGLVTGQRQGQEVRYALVPEPLDEAATWLAESVRAGTSASNACASSCSPTPRPASSIRNVKIGLIGLGTMGGKTATTCSGLATR